MANCELRSMLAYNSFLDRPSLRIFEISMEFETHIGKLDYLLGVNYIFVPNRYVKAMGGLKCGRLVCTLNGKEKFQCGFMSLGNGDAYITLNKARMKKLKLQIGDQVQVFLEPDQSEYGMDMCEELQEIFRQDPDVKELFDQLKPGMQRALIYQISSAKSSEKRLERALKITERIREIPTEKITFRLLLGKS